MTAPWTVAAVIVAVAAGGVVLATRSHSPHPSSLVSRRAAGVSTGGSRGRPIAQGSAAIALLPRANERGQILFTTSSCRLGRVTDGAAITLLRPDVRACYARAAPAPLIAIISGNVPGDSSLLVVGSEARADRRLPRLQSRPTLTAADDGSLAGCIGPWPDLLGVTTIVSSSGQAQQLAGCWPARWQRRWLRIARPGLVVDRRGRVAIHPPADGEAMMNTGALAVSPDGRTLAVYVHRREQTILATYERRSRSAVASFVIGGQDDLTGPNDFRVGDNGDVVAVQRGTPVAWTLLRPDGSAPPLTDIAGEPIIDVAFAPNGTTIAAAAAGHIVFLDPTTLAPVAQLPIDARTIDWSRSATPGPTGAATTMNVGS